MSRRILIALFCAMVAAWWAETPTGRMFVMELEFAVERMQIVAEVYWEHYVESN